MAASSYEAALARVLAHEGGYTNDPADPGGPTNFGITIHDYRKYVKPAATATDVRAMTVDEAKAIYRGQYWDAQRCDELPAGVDYAVFDYGVNSGIGRSVKVLQQCLGVAMDGKIGPATLAAAAAADAEALIAEICDKRLRFLQSLRTWPVFGKGWARRVAEVKSAALAMAATAKPAPVAATPVVPASHAAGLAALLAALAAALAAHSRAIAIAAAAAAAAALIVPLFIRFNKGS